MTRRNRWLLVAPALLLVGALAGTWSFAKGSHSQAWDKGIRPSQDAPNFTLKDQASKDVSLTDYKGKIIVLEWTNPQCPFVQRHYQEKTMTTLAAAFKDKDVVWLAINSTRDATIDSNKQWADQQSIPYPVLDDSKHDVVDVYGATNTPTMYVINKDGKVVYRGAIDNDPQGEMAADKRTNYVKQALSEVLDGKDVSIPQTRPYGCGIH